MFFSKSILFLLPFFFLISCSSTPKPIDGSDEKFAKEAIFIKYTSSDALNVYDNQPHVIPLVVYQLNNINSFESLDKSKEGVIKLLEAKKFDSSVMSVIKYYVSPNETQELFLNRATKTVWVAMVVGYYDMQPLQSTLKYKIPPYNNLKFWKSEAKQKFLPINVYFDKSSIQQR